MNDDTRSVFAFAGAFTATDYLQAQRLRRRQAEHWARAFQGVDLIASPTTATAADAIPRGAESRGAPRAALLCERPAPAAAAGGRGASPPHRCRPPPPAAPQAC